MPQNQASPASEHPSSLSVKWGHPYPTLLHFWTDCSARCKTVEWQKWVLKLSTNHPLRFPRLHFLLFHRGLCLLVFVSGVHLPLHGGDQCIIAPVLTPVEREVMSGQSSVLDLHWLPKLKSVLWSYDLGTHPTVMKCGYHFDHLPAFYLIREALLWLPPTEAAALPLSQLLLAVIHMHGRSAFTELWFFFRKREGATLQRRVFFS